MKAIQLGGIGGREMVLAFFIVLAIKITKGDLDLAVDSLLELNDLNEGH